MTAPDMRVSWRHPEEARGEAACRAPEDVTGFGGHTYGGSRPEYLRLIEQRSERQERLIWELEPGSGKLVAG